MHSRIWSCILSHLTRFAVIQWVSNPVCRPVRLSAIPTVFQSSSQSPRHTITLPASHSKHHLYLVSHMVIQSGVYTYLIQIHIHLRSRVASLEVTTQRDLDPLLAATRRVGGGGVGRTGGDGAEPDAAAGSVKKWGGAAMRGLRQGCAGRDRECGSGAAWIAAPRAIIG